MKPFVLDRFRLRPLPRRRAAFAAAAGAVLALHAWSPASTFTWTGGGTGLTAAAWDYSIAGAFTNWDPAVLPSASDDVVLGSGFASGNPNLNGSRTVRSLTIDTASGVSLVGASASDGLTLTSGGLTRTAASSGTQTIDVPITPGASGFWNIGGGGALVLNGQINAGASGTRIRKFGAGTLVFATVAPGGAFTGDLADSMLEVDAGALLVTGAAAKTLPSNVAIKSGTFSLSATTDIVSVNTLSVDGFGVLQLNGSSFSVQTLNGTSIVASGIDLGGGSLLVNVGGSYSGNITGGGEVYIAGSSGLFWSGNNNDVGSLHVGNSGAASLGGFFFLRGTGNSLEVANGGSVQIGANASVSATNGAVRIGEFAGPDGVLTVAGTLSSPSGAIGASGLAGNTGGRGRVVVTGSGAMWNLSQGLALGGDQAGPGGVGTLVVSSGGAVYVAGTPTRIWTAGSTIDVDGGRFLTGGILGAPGVGTIRISDGSLGTALSLGTASATDAFTFAGPISDSTSGPGSLAKNGANRQSFTGVAGYTGRTDINGGTLEIPQGLGTPGGTVTIGATATFATAGVVQRPIAGAGTLTAAGTLYVGMPTSVTGFAFDGALNVGTTNVQLMDADAAGLGTITMLAAGGRLGAVNGALLASGRTLTAAGGATINGTFTNQGTVNGPTAPAQFLTFVDDVNGAGGYTGNVAFSDGFSPGNSPAIVSAQNVAFDGSSVLTIELGGTTAGSGYDRVDASGTVAFAGTVAVQSVNGFVPLPGQTFEVVRFASRTGDFAMVVNQTPFAGLRFNRTYGATALTLTAWALPGDADLNAVVDLTDFTFLAAHFNTSGNTWLTGDFDGNGNVDLTDFTFLAAHFNEMTPAGVVASPLGAAVPEPAVTTILCAASIALCRARRRR